MATLTALSLIHSFWCLTFECEFSSDVEYHVIGTPYRCEVKNLEVLTDDKTVTKISGNHKTGKSNSDVKLISIQEQNMRSFPGNISNFFPNVEGLIIDDCSLKTISKIDLVNFPNLKLLFIGNNKINSLDSDLFEGCPRIEYLVFKNNFTKRIGSEILSPLSKLKFANFERNTCIRMKATNPDEIEILKNEIEKRCK